MIDSRTRLTMILTDSNVFTRFDLVLMCKTEIPLRCHNYSNCLSTGMSYRFSRINLYKYAVMTGRDFGRAKMVNKTITAVHNTNFRRQKCSLRCDSKECSEMFLVSTV